MISNSYISIGMYFYHGDHLGSATWITDTNGLPVQYILYDPWGGQFANRNAYGSSGVTERYTFTGQRFGLARAEKNELASFAMPSVRNENKRSAVKEFDEETKYYNFEARQYDHWLRIFTAPDPLSDQTPDISPYAYCAWNPQKYSDPLYIQDEIIVNNQNYKVGQAFAGNAVTDIKSKGNVIVENGGELVIDSNKETILDNGFEVKLGGKLTIK